MNKKKLLALLMALVMTLSLMPVTAFAEEGNVAKIGSTEYETLQAAIAAANDDDTVTLIGDASGFGENGIQVPTNLTLDLNGHKIDNGNYMIMAVSSGKRLVIKDETGKGKIISKYSEDGAFAVWNGGSLVLQGGTVINNEGCPFGTMPSASVEIAGGKVVTDNSVVITPVNATSTLTISGGEIEASNLWTTGWLGGTVSVTIEGGSFKGGVTTNSTATAIGNNAVASGLKVVEEDGWYKVVPDVPNVAKIGDTEYATLAAAVAAVPANGTATTITMIADYEVPMDHADSSSGGFNVVNIAKDQNVILDLNGKTITGVIAKDAKNSAVITVSEYGTLTIRDSSAAQSGTITHVKYDDGVRVGNWAAQNWQTDIIFNHGGTLTIEGGTIANTANGNICYAIDNSNNYRHNDATLTITGGTITSQYCDTIRMRLDNPVYGENSGRNVINISGGTISGRGGIWAHVASGTAPKGRLTITGGTITGGDGGTLTYYAGTGVSIDDFPASISGGKIAGSVELPQEKYISGGVFSEVIDENKVADGFTRITNTAAETKDAYPYTVGVEAQPVAEVNGTQYATLDEAIAAAQDGETVRLLQNIALDRTTTIEKSITIDGNHKSLTVTGGNDANKYALYVVDDYVAKKLDVAIRDLTMTTTGYQVAVMLNGGNDSTLALNNVNITCDGECIYANGLTSASANNCNFTHNGTYADKKDAVYYSALIVGYGGKLEVTDCRVESFGNGASTFPSGGSITLTNTDITINEDVSNYEYAGYAIWSRNEDYTWYPELCRDSVITFHSGKVSGDFQITDKYPTGHEKHKYVAKIVIDGGVFSKSPANIDGVVIKTGYKVIPNTDSATSDTYGWTIGVKEDDFVEVKDTVNKEVTHTNTNTNTAFSFATATTENTDDVTYAIKTTTTGGQDNQVAYTPVQTDVVTKPAVSEDAANVSSTASTDEVNDVKDAVEASAASGTTKIQAKQGEGNYGDVNLLTTQAAANAITKAAAAYTGGANNIAKVEIQLQTELTSYTLADKDESVVTTALIYQVTPQAVLLNASGVQLGDAETLTNDDLAAQDLTLKFRLPVPDSAYAVSDKVIVTHRSDEYGDSTSLLDVQVEAGNYYVVIETTHFSEFELKPYVVAGTNELISASLTLGGSIDLNFYLKLQNDVTAVRFTYRGTTTTVPVTASSYDSVKSRYKFSIPVAAKDIYKDVKIELLNANDETQGFSLTNVPNSEDNKYTYSVVQYVNYVKEHGSSEAVKALARSLGTYGYYANLHILKGESHPIYDTVNDSNDSNIINFKDLRITTGTNLMNGGGMTLLLRSETVIAYRFDYSEGKSDYSGYKFYFTHSYTYADGGYTKEVRYEVTPVHTGTYWYVESKGIPAAYLDKDVTFEIVSGADVVYSTIYSPMIYGGSMLDKTTTSDTLKDTIRAMYDYNQKAIACFGN